MKNLLKLTLVILLILFQLITLYAQDTTPPSVTSTNPVNGAIDVPVGIALTINFDEPLNTNITTFGITPSDPGGWDTIWNATNNQYFISHNDFNSATQYIYVINFEDTAGNSSSYNLIFTTEGASTSTIYNNLDKLEGTKIFPNPFSSSATLKTVYKIKNGELNIYNLYGQQVLKMGHLTSQETKIERGGLPASIYFYQLKEGNKIIGLGKILIK